MGQSFPALACILESPGRIKVTETLASPRDSEVSGMGRVPRGGELYSLPRRFSDVARLRPTTRLGCIWDAWKVPED